MNCTQANKIEIISFLNAAGHTPKRRYPGHWWYVSPIPRANGKQEKNASFAVDILNNLWYDKALDTGGDLVNLVRMMHNTNTAGALEIIAGNSLNLFSFEKQIDFSDGITIKHSQPIRNKALIQYLQERLIPVQIARQYLREVYYQLSGNDRQYFSLAFKNDLGGYALRNRYSKTAVSPAYFTTIEGKHQDQVNVFEGIFDFLSALVYFKTEIPKFDCIVLNSTSHTNNMLPLLNQYKRVNLFLDNDTTGFKVQETIKKHHRHIIDYASKIYPDHNDFNEFLMNGKKQPNIKSTAERSKVG